jgi:hypothetical protein
VLPITPRGSPAWSWPLHLDKRSVGGVETSRKDRGDVEGDGRIASKDRRRVGDIEFRLLQGSHVCRMGLIQKDGLFAEHRHASDLHSILDDLYSATPEEKQLARL